MTLHKFFTRLQVSLLMTFLTAGVISMGALLLDHTDQALLRFFEYLAFGTLLAYFSGFPKIRTQQDNKRK